MRELVLGILLVSTAYADTLVHTPLPLETESPTLPPVLTGEQIFKSLGISIPDVTTPAPKQSQATKGGPLTLPELPIRHIDNLDSQILGVLNPPAEKSDPVWPPYMDDLWPDIMLASRNLPENRDIVESMMAYMPIVRRLMELQAREKGEELTEIQKYQLAWTNRYIPPLMEFAHNVSFDKVLYNDAPLNEAPDNELTDMIFSLLPDVSDIIVNLKKTYGGFPGADKSLKIVEAFMPIAFKTAEYNANKEGRNLTKEELDHLNFAKRVVPPIMAYAEDVGNGNKKAFEHHGIMKLVNKAYQDEVLHLPPKPTDGRLAYEGNNPHHQPRPQHGNTHFQDNRHIRPSHHEGNTYHRQGQFSQPQPQPQPQHTAARPVVHQGPPPTHYYQPQHPVVKRKKTFKPRRFS